MSGYKFFVFKNKHGALRVQFLDNENLPLGIGSGSFESKSEIELLIKAIKRNSPLMQRYEIRDVCCLYDEDHCNSIFLSESHYKEFDAEQMREVFLEEMANAPIIYEEGIQKKG